MLYGISQQRQLSRWVFKGGTCLKKCFFETYRFSEDLDFTVPAGEPLTVELIEVSLREVCEWITAESGIELPSDRVTVEAYPNKQGTESFNVRVGYIGPLRFTGQRMQRVKFDITQQELLVDPANHRDVFHRYGDAIKPTPRVACYSVNEILAEKTRALFERQGRARDVYDVIHISRSFREDISADRARQILNEKFAFKKLPQPRVDMIVARVDAETLRRNWDDQLAHQLPILPPVETFFDELREALAWWMEPAEASPVMASISSNLDERRLPREHFPSFAVTQVERGLPSGAEGNAIDQIRFAARNRLLVEVTYHGVTRVVEPYSVRIANTGNKLLYAWEVTRGSSRTGRTKSFNLLEVHSVRILEQPFAPRYGIEL
jgi:predicted nucleotidyltransferase component of viral defense system